MLTLLLSAAAFAADGPTFWGRQAVAVSGWPTGLLSTTIAEARTPLYRSDSIVFRDTYIGAGAQVMLSPAFAITGARVAVSPIDVFEITFRGAHGWYFGNGLGPMPFDSVTGSSTGERADRETEGFSTELWSAAVDPTLKGKVWNIVFFSAWSVEYLAFDQPSDVASTYTYEPLRDLVVAWNDVAFEHQAAVLYQALPGGDQPSLRFGPTFRDRWAHVSGDRSTAVGALVAARPGVKPAVPTIVGLVLWYVDDNDYGGAVPYVAGQVRWELERPIGAKAAAGR
jgi:hypothetical protein